MRNKNQNLHFKFLKVLFKDLHQDCQIASSITIEPISTNDWEILVKSNISIFFIVDKLIEILFKT